MHGNLDCLLDVNNILKRSSFGLVWMRIEQRCISLKGKCPNTKWQCSHHTQHCEKYTGSRITSKSSR